MTRAIRAKADTPSQINEMFDGITYQKGGAVLDMTENYEGEEVFRRGVHNILPRICTATRPPRTSGMRRPQTQRQADRQSHGQLYCAARRSAVDIYCTAKRRHSASQQRFYLSPDIQATQPQTWTIPVCFKTAAGADATPQCELLSSSQQTLAVPSAPIFYANANDKGYYRTEYAPADYNQILGAIENHLTPPERIGFAGNEWALMRSGRGSIADYMNLAAALRNDQNGGVIDDVADAIRAVDERIATPADRKLLAEWVREQFRPAYDRVKNISHRIQSKNVSCGPPFWQCLAKLATIRRSLPRHSG